MPFRLKAFGVTNKTVLEALSNIEFHEPLETLFVINNDDDAAEAWIREKASQLLKDRFKIHVSTVEDSGYPVDNIMRARNLALDFAREGGFEGLFFIDDDIVVKPDTFSLLWSVNNDIVFGVYLFRQPVVLKNVSPPLPISTLRLATFAYGVVEEEPYEIDVAGGGCMLIRGKALYDERLNFNIVNPAFAEDFNFCLTAKKLGYKLLAQPKAFCGHLQPPPKKADLEEVAIMAAVEAELTLACKGIYFYPLFRKLDPGSLVLPEVRPPSSLVKLSIPMAVQINAGKYLLISGFSRLRELEEGEIETYVFTPTWPLPLEKRLDQQKFFDNCGYRIYLHSYLLDYLGLKKTSGENL